MNIAVGSYTGDGTSSRHITINPNFQPDAVLILNGNGNQAAWGNSALIDAGNGVDASSGNNQTARILSRDSTGFTIGSNNQVNSNGLVYVYICWKNGSTDLKSGSYVGDGTISKAVTGVGFQPVFVLNEQPDSNGDLISRCAADTGTNSYAINSLYTDKGIISLDSDGFHVGNQFSTQNGNGATNQYLALKTASNVATGSFTGNGSAGKAITGVGFKPGCVIFYDETTSGHLYASILDGPQFTNAIFNYDFSTNGSDANGITSMDSDGFTVGNSVHYNRNGDTIKFIAFKNDTQVAPTVATGGFLGIFM